MPSPLEPKLNTREPRAAARALIVCGGKLLAIHMRDAANGGDFYVLPGGGQRFGETLHETLRRECREELRAELVIGELAYVREYIGKNHEFPEQFAGFHAVECVFRCELPPDAVPASGHAPDAAQVSPVWLPLAELERHNLYPKAIRARLARGEKLPLYLGDIN